MAGNGRWDERLHVMGERISVYTTTTWDEDALRGRAGRDAS